MTLRKEEVTSEVVEDVKAQIPLTVHELDILYFEEKIAYEKFKGRDSSKYEEQLRVLVESLRKDEEDLIRKMVQTNIKGKS